ncbi:MAG TPA: hypothetical protein VN554_00480 [Verrucomicrobiae bacterium]|nr:hypothetical protein [Verrucomicrobiae bacterium]
MSETSHGHPEQGPEFTQRFIGAVGSVREYNDRHVSGIGQAASFLTGLFEHGEEEKVAPHEEAQMEKELVQILHTDDLRAMGIDLIDPSQPALEPLDLSEATAEEDQPTSLIMLIGNADTFADTIRRLKPAPEQRPAAAEGVEQALSATLGLIRVAYPGGEVEPETDEELMAAGFAKGVVDKQIGVFLKVKPALTEEGFAEGRVYKKLAEYTTHFFAGTLEDYRGAEELHLFEEQFGPAQWQIDMGPEQMAERWSKAFDYLKQLRDRSSPSPFFTELFTKLRADFDVSRAWLEADDPEAPRRNYPDRYVKPLQGVMDGLAKRWEEDFPLENTFYVSGGIETEQD